MQRYLKRDGIMNQMGQCRQYFYDFVDFVGFACATVFLFLCVAPNLVFAAKEPVGLATNVLGEFSVLRASGIKESLHGKSPLPLFEGDWVHTQADGLAQLALMEGITVTMNEDTKFRILSRWEKAKGLTRILRMTQGELWIQMEGAAIPLEVESPLAIAAVVGGPAPPPQAEPDPDGYDSAVESPREPVEPQHTEFTLRVELDGQTTVQVVEGDVEFGTAFNTWLVTPSTVSVAVRGKRCTKPQPVDVRSTMGWTKALGQ